MSTSPVHGDTDIADADFDDNFSDDETVHDISAADIDTNEFRRAAQESTILVPTLTVLGGIHSGQVFRLRRGRNLVGRDPQAQIFFDNHRISRQHCEIFVTSIDANVESGTDIYRPKPCAELTDLGSTNGTRCNGRRLMPQHPHQLCPRDQIDLGGGVTLTFGVMREDELNHHIHLYRSANQDALTGAYNKRHTLTRLEEEYNWSKHKKRPLSLIVLDLDHFKAVNDTYGHDVGDMVLKSVAHRIQDQLRLEDIFGRFGGEEFVILLRDTSVASAYRVADRIRQKIGRWPIHTSGGALNVTASLGVACSTDGDNDCPQTLFKQADTRLYEAKASGRNCVVGPPGADATPQVTRRR